jgi:hypothetical protein
MTLNPKNYDSSTGGFFNFSDGGECFGRRGKKNYPSTLQLLNL